MKLKINKILLIIFLFSTFLTAQSRLFNYQNLDQIRSYSFDLKYNFNLKCNIEDTTKLEEKSPWGAVLRSAILPGFGQFYNRSYWKIPIIAGVFSYFTYKWFDMQNKYNDYRNRYQESVNINKENTNYKLLRDFYRDERDLFAIYLALSYILNILDAYVDAQLFNFDILTQKNEILINYNITF